MSSALLPPRSRALPGDATRERVFEAALGEFHRVGFARASVARITRDARVSRPTFYFHFPSKEDVLLQLDHAIELAIAERLKRARTLRGAFDAMIDELMQAEESIGSTDLFREMLRVASRRGDDDVVTEGDSPALEELTRQFSEAAERGELRRGVAPERGAVLCLSSLYGICMAARSDDLRADLQDLFSLYVDDAAR